MKKRQKCPKRGQAAFEYILVAAVIGIMILPAAYMFFRYSSDSADQIDKAQLDKLGRDLAAAAERIYYQGPPSRTELEARMPKGVSDIYILGDWATGTQQLMIRARSQDADIEFPFPVGVNVNGSFNASLKDITISAGIKKITIEAYETMPDESGGATSFTHINFGGRCPRSVVFDFNTDGLKDGTDGTFFTNCCTSAAGFPKFRPSVTWQSGWFNTTGDFGGNPYASCINADYNGDCIVDDADRAQFCTTTGLLCAPIDGC